MVYIVLLSVELFMLIKVIIDCTPATLLIALFLGITIPTILANFNIHKKK